MKKTLFLMLFLSAQALGNQEISISKSFAKDECAVACSNSESSTKFQIVKKSVIKSFFKEVPNESQRLTCGSAFIAKLSLKCETCEIFCNPN